MPELKVRDGRSASVKGCISYLTRNGRAIGMDFINCSEMDELERPVWKQMDETRLTVANDRPDLNHGGMMPRTFEHFIISPDPRDEVGLETLRTLCRTWAEKHFGDYEVAIYYHDDNHSNILHAHIVVNNTNLKTGERISSMLRSGGWRGLNDDLQDIARSLGIRAFEKTEKGKGGKDDIRIPMTVQKAARTREEQAIIEAGGYSWKEDIRQRMVCAVKLSRTSSEFLKSCKALGMEVREDGRGEWVYSLSGHDTWQVKGKRLGFDYSRFGIERWIARDRAIKSRKIGLEAASRIRTAIALTIAAGEATPSVLGIIDGRKYAIGDISEMLDLCEDLDIRSLDDFREASAHPMVESERETLRVSWRLASSLGCLPQHRQRADGIRLGGKAVSSGSEADIGQQDITLIANAPEQTKIEIGER